MTLQPTLFYRCMRKQYVCTVHENKRKKCVYVYKNTKHPRILLSLTNSLTHSLTSATEELCTLREPLYFLYVSVSHGLSCVVERPALQILHFPMCWGCYSRYFARLALCICVCQTPVSHPLLRLVSQLHTRREKGLVMRVCTTHISSPSVSHLTAADWWRNNLAVFITIQSVMQFHVKSTTCDTIHFILFCVSCFKEMCRIWSLFSFFLSFHVNNYASVRQLSSIMYQLH